MKIVASRRLGRVPQVRNYSHESKIAAIRRCAERLAKLLRTTELKNAWDDWN